MTRDRMVGQGSVGDIRGPQTWHVATNAIRVASICISCRPRQAAATVGVACEAAFPVVGGPRGGLGQAVRVVARNASQAAFASAVATARAHLLGVTYGIVAKSR